MKFTKTSINGAFIIDLAKNEDERGFLARMWDIDEFKAQGIDFSIQQGYTTTSIKKGTIRGLHFLKVAEQKLTRVTKGSVYEIIIDVRKDSPTYKKMEAFTLKDTDYKMLYMGPGIAHAILTLEDNTDLMNLYSPAYSPGNEGGIRYNDPLFNILWPVEINSISEKDKNWPDFENTIEETKQEVVA